MFCELSDAFKLITSFSNNAEYTKEKLNFVRKLEYNQFEPILHMLNNQSKITDREYSFTHQTIV